MIEKKVLLFAKNGEYYLYSLCCYLFLLCLCLVLLLLVSSFKLSLSESCHQLILKNLFECLFIDKMFQCLWTSLVISSRDWLYVNTSRIFASFEVMLPFSLISSFLSIFSTAFIFYLLLASAWAPHNSVWSKLVYSADPWLYQLPSLTNLGWPESIWRKFWWSMHFQ